MDPLKPNRTNATRHSQAFNNGQNYLRIAGPGSNIERRSDTSNKHKAGHLSVLLPEVSVGFYKRVTQRERRSNRGAGSIRIFPIIKSSRIGSGGRYQLVHPTADRLS